MKRFAASLLILCLLCSLLPTALAAGVSIAFGSSKAAYRPSTGAVLTLRAYSAPAADLTITFADQRGNTYTAVLPKGKTEVQVTVEGLPEDGSKTEFSLVSSDDYVCRAPAVCVAAPRTAASFAFASSIYQSYVGREVTVKLRVENPEKLAAGTKIRICDETGSVLETLEHNPNRSAYSMTFSLDDSWCPGHWLAAWVDGRDTAEDVALVAAGYTGVKAIWGVERSDNKISFTMDSGSHNRYIMTILDILDQYNVKITFFVTGQFAAANPDLVREMAARGHEIGNHSWSHPNFDNLSKEEAYSELTRTSDLLESLTGQEVKLFRPPYGHCSSQTRIIVNALGMQAVRWTHESMDARQEASQENSLKYSTKDMKGGSIILTHVSAGCTVSVLPQILQWYQDNGFEVVRVSDLLLDGDTVLDENGIQHLSE